jgi:cell wall-associated NlpC family hydrolase
MFGVVTIDGSRRTSRGATVAVVAVFGGIVVAGLGAGLLALLVASGGGAGDGCGPAPAGVATAIALEPAGAGRLVGATEYGGPSDPVSGVVGASGMNLLQHPDSYAELGGLTFQTATAMGGLPYMTPLRISWARHSVIAYKRDFGLGGGPIDGLPRVIDLWWQLAERLGISLAAGGWAGPVRIARPPEAGAGNLLGAAASGSDQLVASSPSAQDPAACAPMALGGVPVTSGARARLLPNGQAAAPASAPAAVKEIIAAGNQIAGKPYSYGAAHGAPLSAIEPAYDCSSSVEHLLYGARLLPVTDGEASSGLESFGQAGPGRWVTLYANADHVFMYVAGLRWDTHDAAGPGDGSAGIGWHPLVRSADGFIARHPVAL